MAMVLIENCQFKPFFIYIKLTKLEEKEEKVDISNLTKSAPNLTQHLVAVRLFQLLGTSIRKFQRWRVEGDVLCGMCFVFFKVCSRYFHTLRGIYLN